MSVRGDKPNLHLITDSAGNTMSVGEVQAEWLLENDYIYEGERPGEYGSYELTVQQLQDETHKHPEIRECDFCRAIPTAWRINVRPFIATLADTPQRFERPVWACDPCAELVRCNCKARLVFRAIAENIKYHDKHYPLSADALRRVPKHELRQQIQPQLRDFVYKVFGARIGRPERADA